jgi:hypothetical protein
MVVQFNTNTASLQPIGGRALIKSAFCHTFADDRLKDEQADAAGCTSVVRRRGGAIARMSYVFCGEIHKFQH